MVIGNFLRNFEASSFEKFEFENQDLSLVIAFSQVSDFQGSDDRNKINDFFECLSVDKRNVSQDTGSVNEVQTPISVKIFESFLFLFRGWVFQQKRQHHCFFTRLVLCKLQPAEWDQKRNLKKALRTGKEWSYSSISLRPTISLKPWEIICYFVL